MLRLLLVLAITLVACGDTASVTPDNNLDSSNVDAGNSITADDETWTWVEFPESKCANGQPAGIGINLTDRSDDLLVYFQGGGACWDVNTCFVLNSAANIESGYTAQRLEDEPALRFGAFDRDDADNPFRDMSWVFIPYCTGDLHAGDNVKTYQALGQTRDLHHVGASNVEQFLTRLAPTFGDAPRIFVSGSSAGAYGAQLNFHRFREAFDTAEVHNLSDCGPLVQPYGGRFGEWQAAWSMQAPADCDGCIGADGMTRWLDHLVTTYPDSRFGLLAWDADQVIHLFFNYPLGDSFKNASDALVSERYEQASNANAFVLGGTEHVMLGGLDRIVASDGTALNAWVQEWIDGGEDWRTVTP